jgi:DNA primase
LLIPDAKIDEIRARIDFVGLVQRHGVELKKSGRSLKGRCPFHGENTPSFYVYPEDKQFHCFGCQAHGDVFTFVQRLMGKTFVDTVQDLAREVGVDLEAAVDPGMKERAQLKEATDFAAEHFKQRLWDPLVGRAARDYLHSRGVTDEVARQFGLGWAPNAWSDLADRMREHGLLGFGERAGLVSPRQSGEGFYDMFRGRLIIPIRSSEGRTIAFGGRLLEGDNGPKYLNSKESRLYVKSDTLYGLDLARDEIRKKKSVVLCEGYFDCIGLHQAGVKNAVALCSTALTSGHMAVLSRADAKELVLLLDGDAAGRAAVERLAGAILSAGAQARVASLPDGEDPDTFARKVGPEGVQKLVSESLGLTAWLFAAVLPAAQGASFEEKMGAVARIKPIAQQLPVGLARSAFFSAMAKHFGLPAAELELELKGKPAAAQFKPVPKPVGPTLVEKPTDPLEAYFVAAVMRERSLLQKDVTHRASGIKHSGLRSVLAALSSGTSPEDALFEAPQRLKKALSEVVLPQDDAQLERDFLRACQMLEIAVLKEERLRVNRELSQLPDANNLTDEAKEKMAQMMRVTERLQALDLALKKGS